MRFGDLLRELRLKAGLTQAGLAEASNLDVTTITRLELGTGPHPRNETVESLCEALQDHLAGSDQRRVPELYIAEIPTRRKHVPSRRGRPPSRASSLDGVQASHDTALDWYRRLPSSLVESLRRSTGGQPGDDPAIGQELVRFQRDNPVSNLWTVRGMDQVVLAAVHVINAAGNPTSSRPDVLLTDQGSESVVSRVRPEYSLAWYRALHQLLQRGWNITHLVRLEEDQGRIHELVDRIVALAGTQGTYRPFAFREYGTLVPAYDVMIVPGVGVLALMCTRRSQYVDAAVFYPERPDPELTNSSESATYKAITSMYAAHVGLLKQLTKPAPVGAIYPLIPLDPARPLTFPHELGQAFTSVEATPGDAFHFRAGLSTYSLSGAAQEELARPTLARDDAVAEAAHKVLNHREIRSKAFWENVQGSHVYEIIRKQAFLEFCKDGKYAKDDWLAYICGLTANRDERIEFLEFIRDSLMNEASLQLGLLDESFPDEPGIFWLVKSQSAVIIVAWDSSGGDEKEIDLIVSEPIVAASYEDYFMKIWNSPYIMSDQADVIGFINEQIEWIRANV